MRVRVRARARACECVGEWVRACTTSKLFSATLNLPEVTKIIFSNSSHCTVRHLGQCLIARVFGWVRDRRELTVHIGIA